MADEEEVGEDAAEARALELVGELERHLTAAAERVEDDGLRAPQLRVLDAHALPGARLVGLDLLDDASPAARARVPDEARLRMRPLAIDAADARKAVDEAGPAAQVVPQRLGVGDARAGQHAPRGDR